MKLSDHLERIEERLVRTTAESDMDGLDVVTVADPAILVYTESEVALGLSPTDGFTDDFEQPDPDDF